MKQPLAGAIIFNTAAMAVIIGGGVWGAVTRGPSRFARGWVFLAIAALLILIGALFTIATVRSRRE